MPVAEISGTKLIVRIIDADRLGDEANQFMNDRIMPHLNDGDIWILPSPTSIETASLKSFGFEFFKRSDPPFEERRWAIRRDVEFLDGQEPKNIILWVSDDPSTYEFKGRKFAISDEQEPQASSQRFPNYTPNTSEVITQAFIEHCYLDTLFYLRL